ncbi:MAG: TolC family protein [Bacteroidaceae bacterium]|nr:TolC family protein [Bacteroidaceae bacterium]
MKIYRTLLVFVSLNILTPVLAQSLRECIARGLENNYQMRLVRNEEQVAHNNATWANAGAMPEVDASVAYRPSLTHFDQTTSRATDETTTENNAFDNSVTAGVTLNWTIFDGFKIQTTHKQLLLLEKQSELSTRMAVEELVADISAEYYNCVQQIIRRDNYLYTMELSRERLRIAEINYKTGRFSGLDYQLAHTDFYTDSSSYIRQKEAVLKSQIRLNQLMASKDLEQDVSIADTSILVREDLLLPALWERTLESNTSLLYARQNTEMAELDYKKVLSRNYPYLKLNGQYGYNAYVYGKNTIRDRNNLAVSGGLTLGFNIFDGNRRRERNNARLAIDNRQIQFEQLRHDIHADLTTCYQTYRTNIELLALQQENLRIAKRNLQSALERYKLGDLSGIDLRQVQKSLLDAEESVLQVRYDAKVCEISLLLISGDIVSYVE